MQSPLIWLLFYLLYGLLTIQCAIEYKFVYGTAITSNIKEDEEQKEES